MNLDIRYILCALALAAIWTVAFSWAFMTYAHAHDAKRPDLDEWYGSLQRPGMQNGRYGYSRDTSCCSTFDCHTTQAEVRGDSWWAQLGIPHDVNGRREWKPGPWVKIPKEIIIQDKRNEAGEAVICHNTVWNAKDEINVEETTLFCFLRPNET